MNADGSGQTRLPPDPSEDSVPVWSLDGTRIAFSTTRDGNYEIYVMNADGSGQTRLTNDPAIDFDLAWSPDGTKIAFSGANPSADIYVMNPDGGQTRLTSAPAGDVDPLWSPDSGKIAFTSFRTGNSEIFMMNADGSAQLNLSNDLAPDSEANWQPQPPFPTPPATPTPPPSITPSPTLSPTPSPTTALRPATAGGIAGLVDG